MPSPFPGMDPFLEGYLWVDVHQRIATKLSQMLTPLLRPKYVARLAISIIKDEPGEEEIGIMYPDVEILTATAREAAAVYQTSPALADADASTIVAPLFLPVYIEYKQVIVEIRDRGMNELITSIEILSPANKRHPGFSNYRDKWTRLYHAGVSILEIDLLRRGTRILPSDRIQHAAYLVTLTRAFADRSELWPLRLADRLPVVPVPLRDPDEPVPLDLQAALNAIYEEAAYDLSINYREPPAPPPLSQQDEKWIRKLLKTARAQR